MPDISILEFGVYGFLAYSSMLMLIISTIKEIPATKSHSIVRVIFLIPGALASVILANSGLNIIVDNTSSVITNLNTTEVFTEVVASQIVLQDPVWITVHFLIFAVLMVYIVSQILILFTKIGE